MTRHPFIVMGTNIEWLHEQRNKVCTKALQIAILSATKTFGSKLLAPTEIFYYSGNSYC